MFILFLTSPDGRGNPFFIPDRFLKPVRYKKDCNVKQDKAPKKAAVSKKCKCYRKMGEDFSQLSFPDLGQNVAPSLRLKGC
jgi:hypothetical protein